MPSWQKLGCESSNLEDSMIFDLSFISFWNNGCDLLCYKYMILTDTLLSEQGWCRTLYLMSVPCHSLDTPIETPSYSYSHNFLSQKTVILPVHVEPDWYPKEVATSSAYK